MVKKTRKLTQSALKYRRAWSDGWENAMNEAASILDSRMTRANAIEELRRLARQRGFTQGWERGE